VNCIRRFPGRGIRVWGARTLSSDPLWKYVNVRRLFIFLEASIYYATQWVVFEPNDPRLWARVKQTVTLFLRTQWREGALFGEKEEEAFHVAIGRDTMTEDDILNGRLIIEIGIAPVRPAEFVIFRVYQKTQEAKE
jgi:phage tail sheath protein FI